MRIPEYISKAEVKRVCSELKLRDWTELTDPVVHEEEAAVILNEVNSSKMDIPLEVFKSGLEVELEHGTRFHDANVTNNHPILTGMIVLAHLKETMDYYTRLDIAEIEGDLLKYTQAGNGTKLQEKYKLLVKAKLALANREIKTLNTAG